MTGYNYNIGWKDLYGYKTNKISDIGDSMILLAFVCLAIFGSAFFVSGFFVPGLYDSIIRLSMGICVIGFSLVVIHKETKKGGEIYDARDIGTARIFVSRVPRRHQRRSFGWRYFPNVNIGQKGKGQSNFCV